MKIFFLKNSFCIKPLAWFGIVWNDNAFFTPNVLERGHTAKKTKNTKREHITTSIIQYTCGCCLDEEVLVAFLPVLKWSRRRAEVAVVIRSSGGRGDLGGPDCELTVILGRGLEGGQWLFDDVRGPLLETQLSLA